MGRCLRCRCEFNRAISISKLYCKRCEALQEEKPKTEGKTLRDQLERLKAKGRAS